MILCDFDGTITNIDTCDFLIEKYFGREAMAQLTQGVCSGDIPSNDSYSFFSGISEKIAIAADFAGSGVEIDVHFATLANECRRRDIALKIISCGFRQIIEHFVDIPTKDVYANDLTRIDRDFNKREIVKKIIAERRGAQKIIAERRGAQKIIRATPARERVIFIGDGISDLGVIGIVDILYVKRGSHLHRHCRANGVEHVVFGDFRDIVEDLFGGERELKNGTAAVT